MKLLFPYTVILFISLPLFFSCNNTGQANQSDAAIKEEVKHTMDKVFQSAQEANLDSVLADYDTSPDFASMTDGVTSNFEQMKKDARQFFDSIKKEAFNNKSEDMKIYDHELVNYLYSSSVDITAKNDSVKHMPDYAASFLLKKINDKWKIVFMHQSSSHTTDMAAPTVQKK